MHALRRRLGGRGVAVATAPTPWPRSSGPPGTTRSCPSSSACAPSSCPPAPSTTTPTGACAEADRATHPGRLHRPVHARPGHDRAAPSTSWSRWFLGSHEFLLQCIEAWAAQIVVRYSLDEMFDIQWTLWGETVLPGAKQLKAEYLGITGNTVEDWMKDLQIDATALPGKAFDLSFEMPEPDVGIMTFNRCVAVDQWEAMGRPDILEKNCHSTCPKSMIVTTQDVQPEHEGRHPGHPARGSTRATCAASGGSACATRTTPSTSPWSSPPVVPDDGLRAGRRPGSARPRRRGRTPGADPPG